MSYSVLGIFDVTMAVIYGEGAANAKRRLREEIAKQAHYSHSDPTLQAGPVSANAMYTFQVSPMDCLTDVLSLTNHSSRIYHHKFATPSLRTPL